jgi:hypothetical protein
MNISVSVHLYSILIHRSDTYGQNQISEFPYIALVSYGTFD